MVCGAGRSPGQPSDASYGCASCWDSGNRRRLRLIHPPGMIQLPVFGRPGTVHLVGSLRIRDLHRYRLQPATNDPASCPKSKATPPGGQS